MKRTPLTRKTRLRPVSKKRQARQPERNAVRELVLDRALNRCEANLYDCSYHATDVHEIKTRARGGSIYDESNCLALCRSCHRFITDNPKWSERNGFIVSAWSGVAELEAAKRARRAFRWTIVFEDGCEEPDSNGTFD